MKEKRNLSKKKMQFFRKVLLIAKKNNINTYLTETEGVNTEHTYRFFCRRRNFPTFKFTSERSNRQKVI